MYRVMWTIDPDLEIWHDGCEFSLKSAALENARSMVNLYPDRQRRMWAVCKVHERGVVYPNKARWIFGASQNDLYRAKYGRDLPVNLGHLVEKFDDNVCG